MDEQLMDIKGMPRTWGKNFLKLVAKRQEWKEARDKADEELRDLNMKIMELQAIEGYKTIVTPDWQITLTDGCSVTISKERLVELGVPAATVESATKRTPYQTVTVTKKK
jgi:hypothetical protein